VVREGEPLAEPAIRAVETDDPLRARELAQDLLRVDAQHQDWCISRQLWWGIAFPRGTRRRTAYVGRDEQKCARSTLAASLELEQDEDVLDTWFSSALWPFSTLGWPERTPELERFYPTSVLVTGFDIIFFWVARMIMMGLKFMGDVPFREVYIHGLVRDDDGQKMSKSKGNILDPLDLVDGVDARRAARQAHAGLMQPHMKAAVEKATRKQFPSGMPAFGTTRLRFTFAALATQAATSLRPASDRGLPELLQQALERGPLRVARHARGLARRSAEFGLPERWVRSRLRAAVQATRDISRRIAWTSRRRRSTTSPGTSSATGTSSSPSPCSRTATVGRRRARGTRRTLLEVLERCCASCIR
jgi:valyl-tRNA synthetase